MNEYKNNSWLIVRLFAIIGIVVANHMGAELSELLQKQGKARE